MIPQQAGLPHQEATPWYCYQQAGSASPSPLHGEALLEYYFTLMGAELEPDLQHGKLLAYRALHQGGDSPLRYLADVGLLEPHISDSYPKRAIDERYVD